MPGTHLRAPSSPSRFQRRLHTHYHHRREPPYPCTPSLLYTGPSHTYAHAHKRDLPPYYYPSVCTCARRDAYTSMSRAALGFGMLRELAKALDYVETM